MSVQAALDGAGFTNRFATDKARQGMFQYLLPAAAGLVLPRFGP